MLGGVLVLFYVAPSPKLLVNPGVLAGGPRGTSPAVTVSHKNPCPTENRRNVISQLDVQLGFHTTRPNQGSGNERATVASGTVLPEPRVMTKR